MNQQTQKAEKERRSTKGRNEHKFVPSSDGSMSTRLSTRYTVVPLAAASVSIGVSGCKKCDTSAISMKIVLNILNITTSFRPEYLRTPASILPFDNRLACRASSISWQPR